MVWRVLSLVLVPLLTSWKVAARLDVPRQATDEAYSRPFDVIASNIDVLLEINPEGKVWTGH